MDSDQCGKWAAGIMQHQIVLCIPDALLGKEITHLNILSYKHLEKQNRKESIGAPISVPKQETTSHDKYFF